MSVAAAGAPALPYSIRPCPPRTDPAILGLVQTAMGSEVPATAMTPEFWTWKHLANPFGVSYGVYAWDDQAGQPVGLRVLMRWRFASPQDHTLAAVRAVDTATHPDYQRQGIFSALTNQAIAELRQEGVDLIYNTPNQHSLPGYLKMGWQVAARWPLLIKPLRPLRMAGRRLRPVDADEGDGFEALFRPGVMVWETFAQRHGAQLPELVAAWEAQRRRVGLRTPRDLSYLSWRYGQHPNVAYGVFPLIEQGRAGRLAGFAVMRPNVRYGWQETVLTDLLLSEPDPALGQQLLSELALQLRGDYVIAHAAQGTLEQEVLRRSGFVQVPRKRLVFTVRQLQEGLDDLCSPAAWDLSLGDLEIF